MHTQPPNEDIDFRMFLIVFPELSVPSTLTIEVMFQPDGGSKPVPVSLNEIISNLPLEAVLHETTEPLEPTGPPNSAVASATDFHPARTCDHTFFNCDYKSTTIRD